MFVNKITQKWDKERLDFGSDLDHCLDHLDPGCQMRL